MRTIRSLALAAVAALVSLAPAAAQTHLPPDTVWVAPPAVDPVVDADWNLGGNGIEGIADDPAAAVGRVHPVTCPPEGRLDTGGVWGTFTYTSDSMVCVAAVHAGWIGPEEGGTVWIEFVAGRASYAPSTRNGVESHAYDGWDLSFRFVLPEDPEEEPAGR